VILFVSKQDPVLLRDLVGRLRELPLSDAKADRERRTTLTSLENRDRIDGDALVSLVDIFLAERDQFEAQIVSSDAAGFSHGFWIFK
jgi:hypothetical protein